MQRHRAGKVEQFRLQHGREAQAGTGRHEGGIILSKKPPEWRLSPPYIEPLHRAPHRAATTIDYIERYNELRPILFFKKKGG